MRKKSKSRLLTSVVEAIEPRRLLSAGTLDPAFGSGGEVLQTQHNVDGPEFVGLNPANGNAFVNGLTVVNHTISNGYLEEFTSTGVLDASFGIGGVLSPVLPASISSYFAPGPQVVQPDGKIVIVGYNTLNYVPSIVRLNANGSPDTTFGTNGIETLPNGYSGASAITLQGNGDILIADDSTSTAVVYRLTSTGALDTTFGTNGSTSISVTNQASSQITAFTFDASGRIIAYGNAVVDFPEPGGNGQAVADVGLVARLNTNGTIDTTFNGTGYVTDVIHSDPEDVEYTPVLVATVESDGTILTASSSGYPENSANTIVFNRYNADGSPDTNFGTDGQLTSSIVIGAAYANAPVHAVAQSDGKIVLGTTINKDFDNAGEAGLIRVNADGSLDSTFGNGGYSITTNGDTEIDALAISSAGQLYANVTSQYPSSLAAQSLPFDNPPTRFDSNGALDTSYGYDGIAIGVPNFTTGEAVAVLPNGQSLVAGLVIVGNQTGIYVQRYNNDGSLDTSFAPGAGLGGSSGYTFLGINNVVPESPSQNIGIKLDSLGRIIIGANFNNGANNAEFFRLNSDGTIDTTFGVNGMATPVVSVISGTGTTLQQFTLDSSNRVVATANGANLPVFRLTVNGAMDTTFGSGGVASANPSTANYYQSPSIAIAANGQILIGESAKSTANGTPQLAVTRLNSNGSIDTTFGTSGLAVAPLHASGNSAAATTLAILSNGDILAGGAETFANTGGISVVVARFLSTGKLDTTFGTGGQYIESTSPIALQIENTNAIQVQPDGKLLVTGTYLYAGHAQTQEYSITRLNANGTIDTSFGSNGHVYNTPSHAGYPSNYLLNSAITPNGDLEIVGGFYQGFAIARYELALPVTTGSVSGTVFNDINGDGTQNSGENGISGVKVYYDVYDTGSYVSSDPSTTTSSTGSYTLNGLPEGYIIIREVPPSGERQSTPAIGTGNAVTVGSTPITGQNFGVTSRLYVSGTVTVNGVGQSGLVVYADLNNDGKFESNENNKTTLSDGSFAFQSLTAGTYTFRVVTPAGDVQTTPANNAGINETLGSGGVAQNLTFAFSPQSTATKLTGTVIGTAGSYQNDGNTIAKAFDGILTNYFDGPTANGDYAGLNLGTPKVITQIGYDPRSGFASRMVGGIFQGSNNASFSNAVTLYTVTAAPASGTLTTVNISDTRAYQYVRYLAPNGSYGDVGELAFYGTTPTAPTKVTGTAIGTAGSYRDHGTTIANAFDGSLSTFFDAPAASGDWVGLDLGTAKVVTQVKYAPRSGYEGRMVGGEIQASNTADFSSGVVTLYTISSTPTAGVLTTQSLSNSTAYRYYRYIGPANSYCDIAELEFDV